MGRTVRFLLFPSYSFHLGCAPPTEGTCSKRQLARLLPAPTAELTLANSSPAPRPKLTVPPLALLAMLPCLSLPSSAAPLAGASTASCSSSLSSSSLLSLSCRSLPSRSLTTLSSSLLSTASNSNDSLLPAPSEVLLCNGSGL